MRAFRQFYVEFEGRFCVWNELPRLTAVVANHLGRLEVVEYRGKRGAYEYRLLSENGVEAKIGCNNDCKVWLHLSAPEDDETDLRELAYNIINHPMFLEVNTEKKQKQEPEENTKEAGNGE